MYSLGRRHLARRDRGQVGDDLGEQSAGILLMRAALPEERLDPGEVIQDHRSFQWSLPVVVRRSACDPVKDHVSRGAEQDDRVETVVELRLVPHAPFNEERAIIIGVQQPGKPLLDPEPLPTVQLVGGLNILAILAPARITGVYDAITASAKFSESRRLAGSRHPSHQNPRHRDNPTECQATTCSCGREFRNVARERPIWSLADSYQGGHEVASATCSTQSP